MENIYFTFFTETGASLVTQMVKNLPAMQKTLVWSLGWEHPLEEGMATPSSILAWRIPWTEDPGGLRGCKEQHDWATNIHTHTFLTVILMIKQDWNQWFEWEGCNLFLFPPPPLSKSFISPNDRLHMLVLFQIWEEKSWVPMVTSSIHHGP